MMIMEKRSILHRKLLAWYELRGRKLPWRETKNPYHIWLSEIMLQQTQVGTVIPYYKRFIKNFPTIKKLAQASLMQVLKEWEGLGYYSRGRNLHHSAQIIVDQFRGKFPEDREHLEKLPGVGRSTAGAILSLAFDHREAILDANVKRVLCRLYAVEKNLNDTKVLRVLWEYSHQLLPRKKVSFFNQALMDLGATICTPRKPTCPLCPLENICESRLLGKENSLPIRIRKKRIPQRFFSVGILRHKDRIFIQQRKRQGFLGGLWEFPTLEINSPIKIKIPPTKNIQKSWGIQVKLEKSFNPIQQSYTHFKGTYFPFLFLNENGSDKKGAGIWVPLAQIGNFPFSRVYQKIIGQLRQSLLIPKE